MLVGECQAKYCVPIERLNTVIERLDLKSAHSKFNRLLGVIQIKLGLVLRSFFLAYPDPTVAFLMIRQPCYLMGTKLYLIVGSML